MEEMAEVVFEIIEYFGIKKTICFGVGAGANVFVRLALKIPKLTECLILMNGTCSAATWSDWGYEKVFTSSVVFIHYICVYIRVYLSTCAFVCIHTCLPEYMCICVYTYVFT